MGKKNDMRSRKERFLNQARERKREKEIEEAKGSNAMVYWLIAAFVLVAVLVGYYVWKASSDSQKAAETPTEQTQQDQNKQAEPPKQEEPAKNEEPKADDKKQSTDTNKEPLPISDKPNPVKKIVDGLPSYDYAPPLKIDTTKNYSATLKTTKGDMEMELYADDAPNAVNNFIFLAKDKYYDGIKFHRIMKDFMVQSGDPQGTGFGGPGYKFKHEDNLEHDYEVGTVAYANSGADTNGSQFFIVTDEGPSAEFLKETRAYTIFGKVTKGLDVLADIEDTPVKANEADPSKEKSVPLEEIKIKTIEVKEK